MGDTMFVKKSQNLSVFAFEAEVSKGACKLTSIAQENKDLTYFQRFLCLADTNTSGDLSYSFQKKMNTGVLDQILFCIHSFLGKAFALFEKVRGCRVLTRFFGFPLDFKNIRARIFLKSIVI